MDAKLLAQPAQWTRHPDAYLMFFDGLAGWGLREPRLKFGRVGWKSATSPLVRKEPMRRVICRGATRTLAARWTVPVAGRETSDAPTGRGRTVDPVNRRFDMIAHELPLPGRG